MQYFMDAHVHVEPYFYGGRVEESNPVLDRSRSNPSSYSPSLSCDGRLRCSSVEFVFLFKIVYSLEYFKIVGFYIVFCLDAIFISQEIPHF